MLFNSIEFVIFLITVFTLYYLPFKWFKQQQLSWLLLSSFFFYAYEKPVLLTLLIFSILINTICSYSIFSYENKKAKKILVGGVIFNIFVLAFFKYSPLVASTLSKELDISNDILDLLITVPLPIGISFYTFEGISLLLDLYKGKALIDKDKTSFKDHFIRTSFFISFFPHLIAGPILKAREFYPQMTYKSFESIDWINAIKKIILGFFLKMVIADNLKDVTNAIMYPYFEGQSGINLILLLFGYSFQIFADFAGYSLIAIGIGLLFGYQLPQNFNFPYISSSFSEFWRRWHISLSTWLRDYLYIPLGGNRKGEVRTYFNLFIVMLIGGFWHGAGWNYAVWGAAHGILLLLERAIFKKHVDSQKRNLLGMLVIFLFVTLLWLLFKLTNFDHALYYVELMYTNLGQPVKFGIKELSVVLYSMAVILFHLAYLYRENKLVSKNWSKIELIGYSLMIFFIASNSGSQGEFIYFQF